MDNQHKKISGYRDLTQEEIDLMNEAKALESEVLAFHRKVRGVLVNQSITGSDGDKLRMDQANAMRWHSIARTDIETGFMALVRAVAQPQPRE